MGTQQDARGAREQARARLEGFNDLAREHAVDQVYSTLMYSSTCLVSGVKQLLVRASFLGVLGPAVAPPLSPISDCVILLLYYSQA